MSESIKSSPLIFTGTVIEIGETKKMGKDPNKPYYTRTIKVDDSDECSQYKNPCTFQATGKNCTWLDSYKVGDKVEITFFLRGRDWKSPKDGVVRNFVTLAIGFIKHADSIATQEDGGEVVGESDPDDIPF